MSLFSKLFGRGSGSAEKAPPAREPELYEGFRIFAEPRPVAAGHQVAARIEKEVGGEVKVHHLLRADTTQSADEAAAHAVHKAKQVIDEQGERIFD